MSTLAISLDPSIMNIHFSEDDIFFELADGRTISAPLVWFPRLLDAAKAQRSNWELIGRGYGVHWPDLDEDISVLGLMGLPD